MDESSSETPFLKSFKASKSVAYLAKKDSNDFNTNCLVHEFFTLTYRRDSGRNRATSFWPRTRE